MIRQVTAGFLVAAAKTHFQAGSGQETGEGREMRGTADREGSKQACPLPLGGAGKSCRFICPLPHGIQPGKGLGGGTTSASEHVGPQQLLHEQGW